MKRAKKFLSLLLALVMVCGLVLPAAQASTYTVKKGDTLWSIAAKTLGKGSRWNEIYKVNTSKIKDPNLIYVGQELYIPDQKGNIVILHSNDVHGAIDGYAAMTALRDEYAAKGDKVIVVDAGDFIQGEPTVSVSEGATAVELMNAAGYQLAAPGNHEFDYGYDNLKALEDKANFRILAANVLKDGAPAFGTNEIIEFASGEKIGFFGLDTPETATKAHPAKIAGVKFLAGQELYNCAQAQVNELKAKGADVIVCLGHLGIDDESVGNRSIDLLNAVTGIDVFIDGHSHSSLDSVIAATNATHTVGDTILTSTGTKFASIGVVTITADGAITATTRAVDDTIPISASSDDILKRAQAIAAEIEAEYGAVFAASEVLLNGDRAPGNRTEETNLGDLITDALLWKANSLGEAVDAAITNGGGIRAAVQVGDITKKDINTVLPFGNTLNIVKVTGNELLEALEASTYCTPTAVGGFPQVAGIQFTVNTGAAFDEGELYPGSTYHKPASIRRVSIQTVGGKAFDPNATYAIATNDFMASGGDTYYAFKAAKVNYDLGVPMDEVVMEYITTQLGGKVTADKYGATQGRITIADGTEEGVTGTVTEVSKYGNITLDTTAKALADAGWKVGDVLNVTVGSQTLEIPLCTGYSDVNNKNLVIRTSTTDETANVIVAINMGNFAGTYNVAVGDSVRFALKESGAYLAQFEARHVDELRTNVRADYASDEVFANFRAITIGDIAEGVLYRTSSPVNPELGRNTYADKFLREAGVKTVMNLADSEETMKGYEGYGESYYATIDVVALNMGVDYTGEDFQAKLKTGLEFLLAHEGPYAFHCTEGKDRAGFVAILLEMLMGGTQAEIEADYMTTFENYYHVEKGTEKYQILAQTAGDMIRTVAGLEAGSDLAGVDLVKAAENYLTGIGLTAEQVTALKTALSTPIAAEKAA